MSLRPRSQLSPGEGSSRTKLGTPSQTQEPAPNSGEDLREHLTPEQIVVSTAVSMEKGSELFHFTQILTERVAAESLSDAEVVREIVKPVPIVSAFHTIPFAHLNNTDSIRNIDILIT